MGIKVDLEWLVISLSLHYIWVEYGETPVSFYYITWTAVSSEMQL